jgi:hypothetical protein
VAALAGWLVDAVRQLSYRPVRGVLPPPRGVVTQAMRLLWFVALLRCAQAAPSPQLPFNNGQQLTVRTQELQLRPTFDAPASPPLLLGQVWMRPLELRWIAMTVECAQGFVVCRCCFRSTTARPTSNWRPASLRVAAQATAPAASSSCRYVCGLYHANWLRIGRLGTTHSGTIATNNGERAHGRVHELSLARHHAD